MVWVFAAVTFVAVALITWGTWLTVKGWNGAIRWALVRKKRNPPAGFMLGGYIGGLGMCILIALIVVLVSEIQKQ